MSKNNDAERTPRQTSKPEPSGELRLLLAFLNASEIYKPRHLADWLEDRGLVAPGTQLTTSDLELATEVRETMRTLLLRGSAKAVDAAAARLDKAMTTGTIRMRIGAGGRIRFEPAIGGLDGALARLCAVLAEAQLEGTWRRLKVCGARNCGAVYFDDSKNHSRKWCSARCCSRGTSLAYRRRNLEEVRKQDRNNAHRRRYGPELISDRRGKPLTSTGSSNVNEP